jgi:hypothetical protein
MRLCGAKTKSGGTCKQPALPNGRCHYHGGRTPSGIASPHYKDGRYSKAIPARLAARYEEAADDPTLLQLGHDVALVDARLADLLNRVDNGESGQLWKKVDEAFTQYRRLKGDTRKGPEAFTILSDTIEAGVSDYAAWSEISSLLEQRRKLVESERKRLVEMQQMLTIQQAMTLIGSLTGIIRRHVTDRNALAAIQAELIQLTTHEARAVIDAEP